MGQLVGAAQELINGECPIHLSEKRLTGQVQLTCTSSRLYAQVDYFWVTTRHSETTIYFSMRGGGCWNRYLKSAIDPTLVWVVPGQLRCFRKRVYFLHLYVWRYAGTFPFAL